MKLPAILRRAAASASVLLPLAASGATPAACEPGPGARPFRASLAFQEQLQGFDCLGAGAPRYAMTGSGTGTQLGQFAIASTNCAAPGGGSVVLFFGQQARLVAADGSTLHATYQGAGAPALSGPAPGLFSLQGSYVISGGTGRFARATGCGTLTGEQSVGARLPPLQSTGRLELDGWIAF